MATSDNKRIEASIREYKGACNNILAEFAEKYDVQVDSDCWVAGDVGTVACINEEFYLNMEDIILMLEKDVDWDEFLRWWDYNLEVSLLELNPINLRTWLMGDMKKRYKPEQLERIRDLRKEIDELTEEALEGIENY